MPTSRSACKNTSSLQRSIYCCGQNNLNSRSHTCLLLSFRLYHQQTDWSELLKVCTSTTLMRTTWVDEKKKVQNNRASGPWVETFSCQGRETNCPIALSFDKRFTKKSPGYFILFVLFPLTSSKQHEARLREGLNVSHKKDLDYRSSCAVAEGIFAK